MLVLQQLPPAIFAKHPPVIMGPRFREDDAENVALRLRLSAARRWQRMVAGSLWLYQTEVIVILFFLVHFQRKAAANEFSHGTATNAPRCRKRYDDIWFITPQVGWAVNSAGEILHTEDGFKTSTIQKTVPGDTWLRCMGFTSPTDGWVGTLSAPAALVENAGRQDLDRHDAAPARGAERGVRASARHRKSVVYASGTQFPDRPAGILKTIDGGETWKSIPMAAHANLLIDNYFTDDLHGWVVGGKGGTTYHELKPVVLFTADGGQTWENRLENSGIDFPSGEWGWKIQFLTPQIGFVSLENSKAAAILKTADGGQTWKRIVVNDPQKNSDLEGVGFINEMVGWAGGWGHDFNPGPG